MIKNELKKRIITSILLFIFAIFTIFVNKIFFIFIIFLVLLFSLIEWYKINLNYYKRRKLKYKCIGFFGTIFALFVLFASINLRGNSTESALFFIFIITICAGSDIGGYIFGKTIGGKKLIKISPNKTISGSVGSLIFSLLPLFLFNMQNYFAFDFNVSIKNIFFCFIVSLSCQLGDLIISYFKRLNKMKDTGNILPGHGGLLDRIDGIIFSIPAVYFLKTVQIF